MDIQTLEMQLPTQNYDLVADAYVVFLNNYKVGENLILISKGGDLPAHKTLLVKVIEEATREALPNARTLLLQDEEDQYYLLYFGHDPAAETQHGRLVWRK